MTSKADLMDKEANIFAMELLMPRKMVKEYVQEYCGGSIDLNDDIEVRKIANRFNVDVAIMTARLIDLRNYL